MSASCRRPIKLPVNRPASGLRRAVAKPMVTSSGRSKMEKKGSRRGSHAWRKTAVRGIRIVAGILKR